MTIYVLRRVLMMIPVLFIGSVIVFVIIQLPPGNAILAFNFIGDGMRDAADPYAKV